MSDTEKICLTELHCAGPIDAFIQLSQFNHIILDPCEHYKKGTWRNRYQIAGPNRVLDLSIPIRKGKNYQKRITEIQIAYDEAWQQKHINALRTAYGKSAFYEEYSIELFDIFSTKFTTLWELNHLLFLFINKCLQWDKTISTIESCTVKMSDFVDLRNRFTPKSSNNNTVRSSSAVRSLQFLTPSLSTYSYNQVFMEKHGFRPGLSVLDLIFCCGPESGLLLRQFGEL